VGGRDERGRAGPSLADANELTLCLDEAKRLPKGDKLPGESFK